MSAAGMRKEIAAYLRAVDHVEGVELDQPNYAEVRRHETACELIAARHGLSMVVAIDVLRKGDTWGLPVLGQAPIPYGDDVVVWLRKLCAEITNG